MNIFEILWQVCYFFIQIVGVFLWTFVMVQLFFYLLLVVYIFFRVVGDLSMMTDKTILFILLINYFILTQCVYCYYLFS